MSSLGGSREEKKARSRRRIVDSARDVFFRDGFMAANLDEVADRAGVAKGTLYRYFESKADLYVAVLADNGRAFTERMVQSAEPGATALDQLRLISRFYLDYWTRHPEYFQIFWAIDNEEVIGDLPAEVVAEVSKLWEQSLAIVSEVLQRGVASGEFIECDPWEVSNILWTLANSLIQGESTRTRRMLRRRTLPEVYQDAIELVIRGLVRPSG